MMIERFGGYVPRVNGMVCPTFPLPGGGYEGITRKLDRAVLRAAGWLGRRFNRPVLLRFNSDRRSGGAWFKDSHRDHAGVSIQAVLLVRRPTEASAVHWRVFIHRDFLLEPQDRGRRGGECYGYWHVASLARAKSILAARLNVWKLLAETVDQGTQGEPQHVADKQAIE
ncbi:MAG: hypothetical protein WCK05_15745 [Planctomycetota bacterium]